MSRVVGVDVGGTFTDVVVLDGPSVVGPSGSTSPATTEPWRGARTRRNARTSVVRRPAEEMSTFKSPRDPGTPASSRDRER